MITGITCGSFDYIIHDGHMLFLNQCKQLCDILYAALVADETIKVNKFREPYYPQHVRAINLINTGLVDEVITLIHHEDRRRLFWTSPDIYIIGKDQNDNQWTQETMKIMFESGVSVISTFERRINSTTRLLQQAGYLLVE